MKFSFIAKHRGIWPAGWLCGALGVSRGGFYAWLMRPPSKRARRNEELSAKVRASFIASDRTYGARRVWRDVLADGVSCGLHRIERLMRQQALRARPRRRRLPSDTGDRSTNAIAAKVLDRAFVAPAPNRKWIADFKINAEGIFRIEPPCFNDQGVREIAINAPVALLVGIGQIAACDVPANTEMIEFGLLRAQTDFDVAQALTKRQLRKRHAQVLIQM